MNSLAITQKINNVTKKQAREARKPIIIKVVNRKKDSK